MESNNYTFSSRGVYAKIVIILSLNRIREEREVQAPWTNTWLEISFSIL